MALRSAWIGVCLLGLIGAGLAEGVQAHSKAPKVTPADGSVLAEAPPALGFSFSEAIRLTAVRLYDESGREVELPGRRDMTAAQDREIALPPLDAGLYRVEWRALAADGHPMKGAFSFTIAPATIAPAN